MTCSSGWYQETSVSQLCATASHASLQKNFNLVGLTYGVAFWQLALLLGVPVWCGRNVRWLRSVIPANELLDGSQLRQTYCFDGASCHGADFPTYEDSHRLKKSDRALIPSYENHFGDFGLLFLRLVVGSFINLDVSWYVNLFFEPDTCSLRTLTSAFTSLATIKAGSRYLILFESNL